MTSATTVLVVENEPDIMEFVRTVLVDNDLNVVGASDGEEALSYLEANAAPSLVLLDFSMPNMDGFEFRARQLKDERLRSIPVVFMTALEQIPAQRDRYDRVVCLKKPFTDDELINVVKRIVG
jgi:CheY-like chemotaxis protein